MATTVSPRDVREKKFTTRGLLWSGDWYRADEVDEFLDQVAATLELVGADNIRLTRRLKLRERNES
ncbi:hypothetical protein DSM100688_0419 [Bifidobacterium ramosum]|uniref:Cell wall synthesis protein Wag31 n=1 Tax=Bifidobacterium ramosum TaxID=1798158 RepID=A0A6L4X2I1_9BIFI|nr:DivIVA domain-containing protein [Bifidobacterium ramosum]KAB8289339.1 hypothetical protein DSM100688_0419 [Bifidobacterium ramosum]NEG71037.1 DivIVA domain-containing protein [Bifidobacterium ramosum]